MLDSDCRAWLIEVNSSPGVASFLLEHMAYDLVSTAISSVYPTTGFTHPCEAAGVDSAAAEAAAGPSMPPAAASGLVPRIPLRGHAKGPSRREGNHERLGKLVITAPSELAVNGSIAADGLDTRWPCHAVAEDERGTRHPVALDADGSIEHIYPRYSKGQRYNLWGFEKLKF